LLEEEKVWWRETEEREWDTKSAKLTEKWKEEKEQGQCVQVRRAASFCDARNET